MPLMRSRWSGRVVTVAPEHVADRLALGYSVIDGTEPPEPEQVEEPEGGPEPVESDPLPDDGSTISEIRAYAKAHGIELPRRASKAELLALLR